MKRKNSFYLIIPILFFLIIHTPTIAQKASFYDLTVKVDVEKKSISGTNEMHLERSKLASNVNFQLNPVYYIETVEVFVKKKWKKTSFTRSKNQVQVELPKKVASNSKVKIKVTYSGKPFEAMSPPWQGGFSWGKSENGQDWIGVTCQVQGADIWWPCISDWKERPDSMKMHFTLPKELTCVSNGILSGKTENDDKTTTWNWSVQHPINPYNVTLNAAPFELKTSQFKSVSGKEFPVQLWFLPEHTQKAMDFYPQIGRQMSFLEATLGPYPFADEKYAVIESPYSGMEHQTAVSIDANYRNNSSGFHQIHFHQLAHQWWGNMVSSDWKDFWIHEGFAQYMEALYIENLKGSEDYTKFMRSSYDRMLNTQPIAYKKDVSADEVYFIQNGKNNIINRDYSVKGAYFLHLLRLEMGNKRFFEWLKKVSKAGEKNQRDRFRFITTSDLLASANDIAGKDLTELFESVLYQSELPGKYAFSELESIVTTTTDGQQRLELMTGQMLLFGVRGTSINSKDAVARGIKDGKIGGIILYEHNINKNAAKKDLKKLVGDLQSFSPTRLLITIDEEGGLVNRLKPKYGFPKTQSAKYLGELNSKDSTAFYARNTAEILQELGINVNFAPIADLCSNPDNPIIAGVDRCYSADGNVVFVHDSIVVAEHKKRNILPVLKHFPGHGSSTSDSHLGVADVSKAWTDEELIPYKRLIKENNCPAIMTAHIVNAGLEPKKIPATLSYTINQKLLRDSLGFNGLLFSDDLQMKAVSKHFSVEEIITMAVNSGVDVLMFSHNISGTTDHSINLVHQTLIGLVNDGKIPKERIEESFWRIMEYKKNYF